ncbi:hypothetical protein ACFRCQ_13245 [Cytobacillus firmus]|uniref:hypothetical protein n=1 Tax=Cytobacillus firmus TaxID=1399 RepID=UPI0036CD14E4
MEELKTLTQGKVFCYEGSVKDGISIVYGKAGYVSKVSSDTLHRLIKTFESKTVQIQATRTVTDLIEGSLGYWLNKHIKGPVITS